MHNNHINHQNLIIQKHSLISFNQQSNNQNSKQSVKDIVTMVNVIPRITNPVENFSPLI